MVVAGLPPTLAVGRWRVDGACEDEYGQDYELRGVLEVAADLSVRGHLHEDGSTDSILVAGRAGAGRLRVQLRYAASPDTYKYDGELSTVRPPRAETACSAATTHDGSSARASM
jgi:hypothetical protein